MVADVVANDMKKLLYRLEGRKMRIIEEDLATYFVNKGKFRLHPASHKIHEGLVIDTFSQESLHRSPV